MPSRRSRHVAALSALCFAGAVALAPTLAGCGGGGPASGPATVAGTPDAETRTRVQTLHSSAFRMAAQTGFAPESLRWAVFGGGPSGGGAPTPGIGGASAPLLSAFLRDVAAVPPSTRAARVTRLRLSPPSEPRPYPEPTPAPVPPSLYFDYYLGLWVEITETTERTVYALFEDEAKTRAAGSIETTRPADWSTYPQVYRSSYAFTAGYLAGARGTAENVTNADGGGRSSHEDRYADGGKDTSRSSWSGRGDYSYESRTETADGRWTEARGTFRASGGGATRYTSSGGYAADYTYNADGSGRGRITGPDPGLPVTITWDAFGNTTIRYADGTTETIPAGRYGYGGGYGGGGGGAVVGSPGATPGATP